MRSLRIRLLCCAALMPLALGAARALCAADDPATSGAPQGAGDAPPRGGADIALVLPLDAPEYQRAAEAVRAGFLDAAGSAGARERVFVVAHDNAAVVDAFTRARDNGARVIVGPLVRDHLRALVAADISLPPTIALNQLDDGAPMPPLIYTLALAIESDAREIARRATRDGARRVVIVQGDTPLMKRFAGAFTGEWLLDGGEPPREVAFAATPDGLAALRRDLDGLQVDVALIAVEGADAALVRTYAPRVTTYASAQINQAAALGTMRDLDDMRVVDLPWLVVPDAPQFARLPHKSYSNVALDRLYALGLDAFRVADAFRAGVPERFALDGATGHLALGEGRQIARSGMLAVFHEGRLVPLEPTP